MDRNEQKERDKLFRQSLGKFFIDLSKLVFAGVVVGGVVHAIEGLCAYGRHGCLRHIGFLHLRICWI